MGQIFAKSEYKDARARFSGQEVKMLHKVFRDLAEREQPRNRISKQTFLRYMDLPGMLGERFFTVLDLDRTKQMTFEEFVRGLALCLKGTADEKHKLIFDMFNLNEDEGISREELFAVTYSVVKSACRILDASVHEGGAAGATLRGPPGVPGKAKGGSLARLLVPPEECGEACASGPGDGASRRPAPSAAKRGAPTLSPPGTAPVRQRSIRTLVQAMVDEAFADARVLPGGKLTYGQFTAWAARNPVIMDSILHSECVLRESDRLQSQSISRRAEVPCRDLSSPAVPPFKGFPAAFIEAMHLNHHLIAEPAHADPGTRIEGVLYQLSRHRRHHYTPRYYVLKDDFLYSYKIVAGLRTLLRLRGCRFLPGVYLRQCEQAIHPKDRLPATMRAAGVLRGIQMSYHRVEEVFYMPTHAAHQPWWAAMLAATAVRSLENEYTLGALLGQGSWAKVFEGVHIRSGQRVAVKVVRKKQLGSEEEEECLRQEVACLRLVHHPHIVQLIDVFETETAIHLVMELLQGPDLLSRFSGGERCSELLARRIMRETLDAIAYLHDIGIVHRDLKPNNIMMTHPGEQAPVKILDFGVSRIVVPKEQVRGPVGTFKYFAPEILTGQAYNKPVDVWCCGIIMYRLLTGEFPFSGATRSAFIHSIANAQYQKNRPAWQSLSAEAKDLVGRLLRRAAEERLTAKQALEHDWFLQP